MSSALFQLSVRPARTRLTLPQGGRIATLRRMKPMEVGGTIKRSRSIDVNAHPGSDAPGLRALISTGSFPCLIC